MSLFNPNSKFMLYVRTLGDMIILNVLFVICSLPVVTIGAAQAGLYTGLRELFDRDSNNSPSKSFFKGFKNGFLKITCIWTVILLFIATLAYCIYFLYHGIEQKVITTNAPIIVAIVGLLLFCIISSQLTLFHSQFDCVPMLLIKNTLTMVIGFPLKSLLIGIVMWLPVAIFFMDNAYTFIRLSPLWFGVYFSIAEYFSMSLMKKPFEKIIYPDGKPGEDENEDEEETDKKTDDE